MSAKIKNKTKHIEEEPLIKYCLYARKSTEQDDRQVLSIGSQIKEMKEKAHRKNLSIEAVKQESHSAKSSGQRPVFNELMKEIREGKFNGIITWAPDRLSRNAGDLGMLVDLMDNGHLKEIRTNGQVFTDDSPSEKFLLMILGSQAKLENDHRSENVKRGLRAKVEQGLWPALAPTGYKNDDRRGKEGHVIVDKERAPTVKEIFRKVGNENWSGRKIYKWLKNKRNFKTRRGKHLSRSNVYSLIKNTFYYGEFEYPKSSGNWYKGIHKPIITKELYNKAQSNIKNFTKGKRETKLAFTKLIRCGRCNSRISGYEKKKRLKNGDIAKYIYYSCGRGKKLDCHAKQITEKDLVKELKKVIEKISIEKIGMKNKIEKEIKKHRNFQKNIMGHEINDNIGVRKYAKYLLNEGSVYDKRKIVSKLENELKLKNKKLSLDIN